MNPRGRLTRRLHRLASAAIGSMLALGAVQPIACAAEKLLPVDQAGSDSSFAEFRTRLIEAVNSKHAAFVEGVMAPKIVSSFGGSGGAREFTERWKPNRPDTLLWRELGEVLRLGGRFLPPDWAKRKTFCAPYVFKGLPDKYDSSEYAVVVGQNVVVRARPDGGANAVARLTYDIVRLPDRPRTTAKTAIAARPDWVKVQAEGGLSGYVSAKFVRSAIDYRACFSRHGDKWLMDMFVAGD